MAKIGETRRSIELICFIIEGCSALRDERRPLIVI